jgi:hypothetical protein
MVHGIFCRIGSSESAEVDGGFRSEAENTRKGLGSSDFLQLRRGRDSDE